MRYIVQDCPLTKLAAGGLERLHQADDDAVTWLQTVAVTALAN